MKMHLDYKHRAPIAYLVHELARLLKRRFEEEARAHDITLPQWRALAQVAACGSAAQRDLAQSMDADPMTVSGILDRLEKRGLITRYPDPADSRAKLVELTEAGHELLETTRGVGLAMYQAALEGVSDDERRVLESALGRMRDNLIGLTAANEDTLK